MAKFNPFQSIQVSAPGYSWFDLSHDHKTTFDMGDIIPINIMECLPGDKFRVSSEAMLRFQPMIAPIMHRVDIFVHHFFVPNRILWLNGGWEKFISPPYEGSIPPAAPVFGRDGVEPYFEVAVGSLADRMGYPPGFYTELEVCPSALPFAAYQRVWFEYYRDQNLQETSYDNADAFCGLHDGVQSPDLQDRLKKLRKRAWEHDYYTSCLPFAQKGEPVSLPIEIAAYVDIPVNYAATDPTKPWLVKNIDGTPYTMSGPVEADTDLVGPDDSPLNLDPQGTLRAQGNTESISTTTTINDLRAAYALQKFLEKNARGGTRYTETILVHFGVRTSDARLQRPEYLGGSRSTMAISEVLSTNAPRNLDLGNEPLGTMGGHGISVMNSNTVDYFCEEHGFFLSVMSVRPKTAYGQGLPKMFMRKERLDYYWGDFAMLGEEPIKNWEVYLQNDTPNTNFEDFGYLPRYSDYRTILSRISGEMRTSLEYWHLARMFDTPPALDAPFIECRPSKRIFAIQAESEDSVIAHIYNQVQARRPLPKYGNPGGLV